MAEIVKMDRKGRIVIPSEIRNKLGLRDNAQLVVEIRENEIVLVPVVMEQIKNPQHDDSMRGLLSRQV